MSDLEWYVDGKLVHIGKSYTPKEQDCYKVITLKYPKWKITK